MKNKILMTFCILLLAGLMILSGCEEKSEMSSGPSNSGSSSGSGSADASADYGDDDAGGDKGGMMDKVKDAVSGDYTGFMDWEEGMWAETEMKDGSRNIWKIVKADNEKMIFETETFSGGESRVSQIWMDADTKRPIKYVMENQGQIMCMEQNQIPEDATPVQQGEYPADYPDISYGDYTTPTGKTVDVAIFDMAGNRVWVSSEVPFGMVKVEANGEEISWLRDYGRSGAKAKISESAAEDCMSMEDLANSMMEGMSDPSAYEDYQEENPEDYEATATYGGQEQDIDCSMCDGMTGAARNACLASCQ